MQETSNTDSTNMMKYHQDINKNTFLDYVLLNKTEPTDFRNVKIQSVSTEAESHRNSENANVHNGTLSSISSNLLAHLNGGKEFAVEEQSTLIISNVSEHISSHHKGKGKNTLNDPINNSGNNFEEKVKEEIPNMVVGPVQEQTKSKRRESEHGNLHAKYELNNIRSKEKTTQDVSLNDESNNLIIKENKVHKNNNIHAVENGNGKVGSEGKKTNKGKKKGTNEPKKDVLSGNKETKNDGIRENVFENNLSTNESTLTSTRINTEDAGKQGTEKKSGSQFKEKNQKNNLGNQGKEASNDRKKQNKKNGSKSSKHERLEKMEPKGKEILQEPTTAEVANKNDRVKYFMNAFMKSELEENSNSNGIIGTMKEQMEDVVRKGFENHGMNQEFSMHMEGMVAGNKVHSGKGNNENEEYNTPRGFGNYMNMKGLIGVFGNINEIPNEGKNIKNENTEERGRGNSAYMNVELLHKRNDMMMIPMWGKMKAQKDFDNMYDPVNYMMNNKKKTNEQRGENKVNDLEMKNIEEQQNNYFYNLKSEEMFFLNKEANEHEYLFDSMHTMNNNSLDTSMMVPNQSAHNKSLYSFDAMNDLTINSERNSHFYDEKLLSEHSNLFDIFMSYNKSQEKPETDMNTRKNNKETHFVQSSPYVEQVKNYLQETEPVQNTFGNLRNEAVEGLDCRNSRRGIEEVRGKEMENKSINGKENEEEEDVLNKIFNSTDYFQQLRSFGSDSMKNSQTVKNNTNYYPPDSSTNEDGMNRTSNMNMANANFPIMPLMGKYGSMKMVGATGDGKKGSSHNESLQETFQMENFTDQSFQDSFFQDLTFGEKTFQGTGERVYSKSVMYPSGGNMRNPFELDERISNYNKMRNNSTNELINDYGMKHGHAKSLDTGMNWCNDSFLNSGMENNTQNRNKLLYDELMGESNSSLEDKKNGKDFELTNYFDSMNNGRNEINNGMTLDEMKEAMNGDNKNKNSSAKFTLIVNVPPNTTRKDLTAVFSKFGNVDLTMVVCDKQSRHPNKEWTATCGYAFVRFSTNLEAQRTLNATCSGLVRIRGSRVRATWAKKDSYSKREKEVTFKIPSSILIINVEEFICAICKINLSYNPRLFPCCYASCCSDCLRNYIMNEKNQGNIKCPNCSLFIADRIIKIDRTSKGVMALLYKFHCNIKVRCPNEQCKWIGAQYQYLSHMFSCKFGLGQS